jgi:transposase
VHNEPAIAAAWQICLSHQLRDCRYVVEGGRSIFAPRMKALCCVPCHRRRHRSLPESTRREYRRRLEHALDAVMALAPPTGTGSDCESATAGCASTSSPSSTTPR